MHPATCSNVIPQLLLARSIDYKTTPGFGNNTWMPSDEGAVEVSFWSPRDPM
jgi:hypothetical protein